MWNLETNSVNREVRALKALQVLGEHVALVQVSPSYNFPFDDVSAEISD